MGNSSNNQEPFFAQRILSAKPSATKEMTRLANQLKREGHDVITLSQGEPDFAPPTHVMEAAKAAIDANQSYYTEVAGLLSLREAVVRKFERDNGLSFTPDQIQVGCGAKQTLYNALQATVQSGDEVVIPVPAWVSYIEMVVLSGGTPVIVRCGADTGFKLTPEQLDAAITPRTKWLMLNSPSNPSGAVYSAEELQALAEVLRRHPHVWIMADDIYEKIRYDNIAFATPAAVALDLADRTLTINGVSKAFAMTGWRVGYAAGPLELIKAMNLIQSQSTSHTCTISQIAATAALDGPMDFLDVFVKRYEQRRNWVLDSVAQTTGLSCKKPDGAFYALIDCQELLGQCNSIGQLIATDQDFALYLLKEAGVAGVPGSAFGLPGYLRLSYAAADEQLQTALARIKSACEAF